MYRGMSKRLILLVMIGSMGMTTIVGASEIKKEESVYVNLDSSGNVEKRTVTNWIHSDKGNIDVEDETSLKNIENIKGDDKPVKDGDKLKWKVDSSDLYYKGETDKELPFDVSINYYLDDKKINEDELAGKSGKIKIELEFTNKKSKSVDINGKNKTIYTPITTATVVTLPVDKFKDVTINEGTMLSEGNNNIVTFAAFPGLKESLDINDKDLDINLNNKLVIEGYTNSFELGPIMITATTELPDLSNLKKADTLEEIKNSLNKLNDASNELLKGTKALNEGMLKAKVKLDESKSELKSNDSLNEMLGIINSDNQIKKANKLIDDAYFAKNIDTNNFRQMLSLLTDKNISTVKELIQDGQSILESKELIQSSVNTFKGLSSDDNFNKLLQDTLVLKDNYESIDQKTLDKLNGMVSILSGENLISGQNLIKSANEAKNAALPIANTITGSINSSPGSNLNQKTNNFLLGVDSNLKKTQSLLSDENINNITQMSKDIEVFGSSYLILKAMMVCDMKQNNMSLEEAKIKTNQYIEAVYGAKGQNLKNVINGLTENDFTENQINLDTQKMSAYGQSMNEMMSNINELKGLEPLIRVTDEVLSNSNSRNAIANFYSNYKSEASKTLIKQLGDGILSLNADDLKVINGLKSNLIEVSKDIEANKDNIESINKMIDALKGNPKLLKDIDKFSSDLKKSENTINEIEKNLSEVNGDIDIKEVKNLTEKLLSMQQDLKDSEDILRITKGALQKDNISRARELIKSLPELEEGIGDLAEGSTKLNEGMQKFDKEGIKELNNEGQEAIQKIDDLVKTKDKLVELSNEYDTFTGKSNEMDGSVKFIMKTNEIKVQEKENNNEEVKEESKGFINWIKNLVKNIFN